MKTMAPSDQLDYQIKAIHDLIANVTPEQLDTPTPCAKWTVRDLINHMVGGGELFGAALAGETVTMDPDGELPDFLGDNPVAAWDHACATFCNGVDSPGALDRTVSLPFGEMPGNVVLEIGKVDLLIHGWDLAQATGQKYEPPADVTDAAIGAARHIIVPAARNGDTFAAEQTVPSGATPIEQLVAFSGRSV
jgi:uncharacterized protein (TIGR03086 family)